jgi:hypothetical protein
MAAALIYAPVLVVFPHDAEAVMGDATRQASAMAYEAAMKCFVVNGTAIGEQRDTRAKAAYEAKARYSFDVAVRLGEALGYSGDRITQDFGLMQTRELPKLVADPAHIREAVATCKALGLM